MKIERVFPKSNKEGNSDGNFNNCAEISEMIYWATHIEEQAVKVEINRKQSIKYDVSPLIDLALATKDEEWFYQLTAGM